MMNKLTLFCFSIGVGVLSVYAQNQYERSTVTIRVTDQTGVPVTNAFVGVNGYTQRAFEGRSDTNGRFIYTDRIAGGVSCFVYKDGYYETGGQIWVGPVKWTDHPASEYTVVLKKIVNPVPMICKRLRTNVPKLNEPFGFDLEIGDWVKPDGKGNTKDILFSATRRMASRRDHEVRVKIAFSNDLDGCQEFISANPHDINIITSELIPLQVSPITGYTNEIALWQSAVPEQPFKRSWQKNRNYVFRIRSKIDTTGKLVEANYCWTEGDIIIDPGDKTTVYVEFKYYFNPDPHSRSLEPKEIADRQRKCPVK